MNGNVREYVGDLIVNLFPGADTGGMLQRPTVRRAVDAWHVSPAVI